MRVKVYRNLHKDCFSVVSVKTGKVIAHTENIELKNCKFHVQPAGRKKVLEQKRKNVHAYVTGDLVAMSNQVPDTVISDFFELEDAYYNPYKHETFVNYETHEPLHYAKYVYGYNGFCMAYRNEEEALVV